MKAINIRTLQADDVEALLAFELENRDWFERHIDSRGSAFYSVQGIRAHIAAYLAGFAAGTWHPFVIEDQQGRIIGRANLKDIDRAGFRAEVGYRIAEQACGQGLATRALEHLIRVAQTQWKLRELVATGRWRPVYSDAVSWLLARSATVVAALTTKTTITKS